MKVRAVDDANDWLFGKGRNDYAQNNGAVVQLIAMRLKSFLGDCFFDGGAGLDWIARLGSKDPIPLRLDIAATILNAPDVLGIQFLDLNINRVSRVVTIRYAVTTTYSSASGTVTFNPNAV